MLPDSFSYLLMMVTISTSVGLWPARLIADWNEYKCDTLEVKLVPYLQWVEGYLPCVSLIKITENRWRYDNMFENILSKTIVLVNLKAAQ